VHKKKDTNNNSAILRL